MPGSPKSACSAAVMASASSTEVLNASSASSASPTGSTAASGTSSTSSNKDPAWGRVSWGGCSALTLRQPLFEVVDVGAAGHEVGVDHDLAVQRDVGLDALDHHFTERGAHARQRLLARVAVHDDLADHGVVVGRHEIV